MTLGKLSNRRTIFTFGLMATIVATGLILPAFAAEDDEKEPPIIQQMEKISSGYKKLRREARRKTFSEGSKALVKTMLVNSIAAFHEVPPMTKDVPASKKAAFLLQYKAIMKKQIVVMMDLSMALDKGDADGAVKLISQLGTIKKEGHDKYTEE